MGALPFMQMRVVCCPPPHCSTLQAAILILARICLRASFWRTASKTHRAAVRATAAALKLAHLWTASNERQSIAE